MNKQKGLAPVLIVILIALAIGGYLLYQKQFKPVFTPPSLVQSSPGPTVSDEIVNPDSIGANWKTYTNTKYDFQIKYPKYGNIVEINGSRHNGECGNAIEEVNDYIAIDNFFGIFPETWVGTIKDYIKQKDSDGIVLYSIISVPTTDEAIKMDGYDTNKLKVVEGYPPLSYYLYIFRKGDLLVSFRGFQNSGNIGGCIIDPSNKEWVESSLKFN